MTVRRYFKWGLFQKIASMKENESKNYCVESVVSSKGYISTVRNVDCLAGKGTYNTVLKETISKIPDALERSKNAKQAIISDASDN